MKHEIIVVLIISNLYLRVRLAQIVRTRYRQLPSLANEAGRSHLEGRIPSTYWDCSR